MLNDKLVLYVAAVYSCLVWSNIHRRFSSKKYYDII